ncbi:MAG: hypothetical protein HQL90_02510 [Magnetococcales bacterium]|nr:hypothetical protein [Magnetococcales bacterium]
MSDPGSHHRVIEIVALPRGRELAEQTAAVQEPRRSREQDWEANVALLLEAVQQGDWLGAQRTLVYLSTRDWHPMAGKALAQRIWLALKTDTAITEVMLALTALFSQFGAAHEQAGDIAAMAGLLAARRGTDHPDSEWAEVQALQMMQQVQQVNAFSEPGAFEDWFVARGWADPDVFIPRFMKLLEEVVGDDWWLDRDRLQQDLDHYNVHGDAEDP